MMKTFKGIVGFGFTVVGFLAFGIVLPLFWFKYPGLTEVERIAGVLDITFIGMGSAIVGAMILAAIRHGH